MTAEQLREIRKIAREFNRMIKQMRPYDQRPAAFARTLEAGSRMETVPPLSQDYSYVRCERCSAPAILIRDNRNHCFLGACMRCYTLSELNTIVEEK